MAETRFAFILAHMRSGSSLLSHILAANPALAGFGECQTSYLSPHDLTTLCEKIDAVLGIEARKRACVFDKILHNHIEIDDSLLASHRGRFIFLIRQPSPSIASMLTAFPNWFTDSQMPRHVALSKAASYYEARLKHLLYLACLVADRERSLFFTHDEFLHRTQDVFRAIESLLNLAAPLTEKYELLPTTGKARTGDRSEHIYKGFIDHSIRSSSTLPHGPGIHRLDRIYDRIRRLLCKRCQHL